MEDSEEFYTARGYSQLMGKKALTPSMEDYLEMIYRLSHKQGYTRVVDIANSLNVQPPSVSRMIRKLRTRRLLTCERYGIIKMSPEGEEIGRYLINRHNALYEFFWLIGARENTHRDVEGIEHNVSPPTMEAIIRFVQFIKGKEGWIEEYMSYLNMLPEGETRE